MSDYMMMTIAIAFLIVFFLYMEVRYDGCVSVEHVVKQELELY